MHGRASTLGKLFTPSCLDADTLRYYMQSLSWAALRIQPTRAAV